MGFNSGFKGLIIGHQWHLAHLRSQGHCQRPHPR